MIVKEHLAQGRKSIIALCDDNLLGKKISEGNRQLDISSKFYSGKKCEKEDAIKKIRNAYIINAVGSDSVALLKELNLVSEKDVLKIKGTPHIQIVQVMDQD